MRDFTLAQRDIISINRVRCHLEVYSLADITTGNGTKLQHCFKLGEKTDNKSTWDWHEEQPSEHDISRWRWALSLLVDETQRLKTPLGAWTACPHHSWIWHYHLATDTIHKKQHG